MDLLLILARIPDFVCLEVLILGLNTRALDLLRGGGKPQVGEVPHLLVVKES